MYNILLQSHAGSWAILVLLLVISYFAPNQKITPMIQRLFYLIMIITGVSMLVMIGFPLLYVFKGILAIVLIGFMEVVVGRRKRSESTKVYWIAVIVLLLIILSIGYDII
ncbi:DUF1516 family protein [Bacillus sp. NTK071]|uniref:DUF1516 family protein n=1 Tax=Guptibacillus hwajinpoensis TaxID=208199 RepID=A0A4U1MBV7_9BACL|nr:MULTISPECIES: DUF1516 family protein [Bacillaceae]MBN8210872.1 DUF1516 family protein [Bacillus sp. NTK071]TKD67490.1 DUF1516 family protein [Pseudalkalibacillus hwajinpoensis]